jgi:hypothetical protein
MPVAFLAGAYDNPWQAAYSALAGRGGLWGLAQGHHSDPFLWSILASLLRGMLLPLAFVLLQLLVRGVLLPAMRHPEAPVSAVLGQGACAGVGGYGERVGGGLGPGVNPGQGADVPAVGLSGEGVFQLESVRGGMLWRVIYFAFRAAWLVVAWVWGRVCTHVRGGVCRALAELCDDPAFLHAVDCAALFE